MDTTLQETRRVVDVSYQHTTRHLLCSYPIESTKVHWVASKHELKYLSGTTDYGLLYRQVDGVSLQGKALQVATVGSPIVSWFNRKQIKWQ